MPGFVLQCDELGDDGAGQCEGVSEWSLLWVCQ